LRGVCRHDEHPDVGRATRRKHWLEDLRLMKAANINMVRTSHYLRRKASSRSPTRWPCT
jgi:beta-galactosidase